MARFKVTCEVEAHCHTEDYVRDHFGKWVIPVPGTVEVERLPDPPIRQRLVMEIESDPGMVPFDPSGWEDDLRRGIGGLPLSVKDRRRRVLSFKAEPDA